jgi:hypothetical protein
MTAEIGGVTASPEDISEAIAILMSRKHSPAVKQPLKAQGNVRRYNPCSSAAPSQGGASRFEPEAHAAHKLAPATDYAQHESGRSHFGRGPRHSC